MELLNLVNLHSLILNKNGECVVLDYDQNGYPDIHVQQDKTGRKGLWAMKDTGSNTVLLEYGFILPQLTH